MQALHAGQHFNRPPLLNVEAWLFDALHELINIQGKCLHELVYRECCHNQKLLNCVRATLAAIGIPTTDQVLQKLPKNSTSKGTEVSAYPACSHSHEHQKITYCHLETWLP